MHLGSGILKNEIIQAFLDYWITNMKGLLYKDIFRDYCSVD